MFWPCVRRDFFLMQINVSYKHVETCGAYALTAEDSESEDVAKPKPKPPPPVSRSM